MEKEIKQWIARKTKTLRHKLVKLLTPTIYKNALLLPVFVSEVPRPMIMFLRKYFGNRRLVGVEIGVDKAINAEFILGFLNINRLFLIDPCERGHFSEAQYRLREFADKILFVKKTSEQAVGEIPNNLDFVYIDGDHSYEMVKQDIVNYYPKVRVGGVIGGHDFFKSDVKKAVIEWAKKHNHKLVTTVADWWFIKKIEK